MHEANPDGSVWRFMHCKRLISETPNDESNDVPTPARGRPNSWNAAAGSSSTNVGRLWEWRTVCNLWRAYRCRPTGIRARIPLCRQPQWAAQLSRPCSVLPGLGIGAERASTDWVEGVIVTTLSSAKRGGTICRREPDVEQGRGPPRAHPRQSWRSALRRQHTAGLFGEGLGLPRANDRSRRSIRPACTL